MRKEYEDELNALKEKMTKAEAFAARVPVLADTILKGKITGEEDHIRLGDHYKKIPLSWGICRSFYRNGGPRYVMNAPKDWEYSRHLFSVYINTINLFDVHQEFGLYDYIKPVDIFFADELNTKFYVTDENIEPLLEALNTWYCDACEKLKAHRLQEEQAKLEKRLEEIKQKKIA